MDFNFSEKYIKKMVSDDSMILCDFMNTGEKTNDTCIKSRRNGILASVPEADMQQNCSLQTLNDRQESSGGFRTV